MDGVRPGRRWRRSGLFEVVRRKRIGAARPPRRALGERLIASQLRQHAVAQQISARVSDVPMNSMSSAMYTTVRVVPMPDYSGSRGRLVHAIVDPAIKAQPLMDHVIGSSRIDPDVPPGEMKGKMRERGNRQATAVSPESTAHAVGDEYPVGRFLETGRQSPSGRLRDRLLVRPNRTT